MKYIAKVENTHIVECNGVNHKVEQVTKREGTPSVEVTRFEHGDICINSDLTVHSLHWRGFTHLAEIVLAIEIVRFVLQNTNK